MKNGLLWSVRRPDVVNNSVFVCLHYSGFELCSSGNIPRKLQPLSLAGKDSRQTGPMITGIKPVDAFELLNDEDWQLKTPPF